MNQNDYHSLLPLLPEQPGVYRFIDKSETVIYVGKAKNLKKRVSSYFTKSHDFGKTGVMIQNAVRVEFTIVDSEQDALLFENTLIKKLRPRYNVSLKDDKTYPYICIKNENFPRVFLTRRIIKDGSEYFGPYTSVARIRIILDFINKMFPLRNCNLNLTQKSIAKNKYKVCLEFHLGNCKGPCQSLQTEEHYLQTITRIKQILKGDIDEVYQWLNDQMEEHSKNYEFESAALLKDKIESLLHYKEGSTVVNPDLNNIDVFSFVEDEHSAFINYMKVLNGSIIQTKTVEVSKKIEELKEDLLQFIVFEIRNQFKSNSSEIIVPFRIDFPNSENLTITIPQRGDKKKLLDLSTQNVFYFRSLQFNNKTSPKTSSERILNTLQKDFRLSDLPIHIECFDNSNFQGSFPVASMVVFKNARPSKKDYRHYNIKTVQGPNDFASMEEIVYRRYKRLIDENQPLPQLIMIDGGKGQLSAAMISIQKLNLKGKVTVAGIAKKLEEIYFPDDQYPLYINKKSESLKLIQQIRNEAHRFAITFHRNQRSKGTIKTALTQIDGIGLATATLLLKNYKSLEKLKTITLAEMELLIGSYKSKLVFDYLHNV